MANPATFQRFLNLGWFPFAETINAEFKSLPALVEAGLNIASWEERLVAAFDPARLNHLLDRWSHRPHFAAKSELQREAMDAFRAERPASVIKIVLTEIEGVLNDAHRAANGGKGAKLKDLLTFARASGEARSGAPDTLLFPAAFGEYLAKHTFAHFDPVAQTGTAGSRHAVGTTRRPPASKPQRMASKCRRSAYPALTDFLLEQGSAASDTTHFRTRPADLATQTRTQAPSRHRCTDAT